MVCTTKDDRPLKIFRERLEPLDHVSVDEVGMIGHGTFFVVKGTPIRMAKMAGCLSHCQNILLKHG
jgi:hypothetical protein